MAKYVFFISGENIKLAHAEIKALLPLFFKKYSEKTSCSRLIAVDCDEKIKNEDLRMLCSRPAFTREIGELLFDCKISELKNQILSYDWKSIYKKDYCLRIVRINDIKNNDVKAKKKAVKNNIAMAKSKEEKSQKNSQNSFSEAGLADLVWKKLEEQGIKPKTNLKNAETKVKIFFCSNCALVALSIAVQEEDFESRKPELRPGFAPVSINPKLARCFVNMLGIKPSEEVLDPFCGTGGLLIEAGLIGCRIIGQDIDEEMLEKCRKNLEYFKIKDFLLKKEDATKIKKSFDYIVSDLPYGRSSRLSEDADLLYKKFFSNIHKILKKRAVIAFANSKKSEEIMRNSISKKLKITACFDHYLHKSLTKRIFIIEKNF